MTSSVQQTRSEPRRRPSKHRGNLYKQSYEDYITSSKWEKRKVAYYAKHEKLCAACKCTENIHLHHHTYDRMGNELDDDLVPLCQEHHDLVHKLHRECGGTLTKVTATFLKLYGASLRPRPIKQARPRSRWKKGPKAKPPRPKRGDEIRPMRFQWAEGDSYAKRPGKKDPVNDALGAIKQRRRGTP